MKIEIEKADLHLLLHTLGLSDQYQKESYRNRFVASDGHSDLPGLLRLCEAELMEEYRAPMFLEKGDRVFMATDLGKTVAQRDRPKPTKAQRRYRRWLSVSDCCPDLTFGEFLTSSEFVGYR